MLSPSNPPFDHENHHRLPITKETAEAFNAAVHPTTPPVLAGRRRRADTTPRARRKKDHQYDELTQARISRLSDDEQHIMKDYAGNTVVSRIETLCKLEEYRRIYGMAPMRAEGQLGPKKGKTKVEWICALCAERKNTFQKIAGHVTSHHWKLKVWTCLDTDCGRQYCSLNELTRHTKETHRNKAPESANTTRNPPMQADLSAPEEFENTPPATYRSGSNYSDTLPRVSSFHVRPSRTLPSTRPRPSNEPVEHAREQVPMRRYSTRSSRAAPYNSMDSKFVHHHNVSSVPRTSPQSRHQQKRSIYHNYTSTVDQHDPLLSLGHNSNQEVSKPNSRPASNERVSHSTMRQTIPTRYGSTNPTDGAAPQVAPGSYSEGGDLSSYPRIPPIQYCDPFAPSTDGYRVGIPNERGPRDGSFQNQFQTHNYPAQESAYSNHLKYSGAWQFSEELFDNGLSSALLPEGLRSLDNIHRQTSPHIYDPVDKNIYDVDSYPLIHSFDDQSGTGRLANEQYDSYSGNYLGQEDYIPYEDDPIQVSRRWLPMIASSRTEGATMAARTRHCSG